MSINLLQRITEVSYDYVVVLTSKFFNEICDEAQLLGINRNQIIHGDVFKIPYFDFKRYIHVKKSNLTIISNNCWGGYVYSILKIPFNSPFIKTLINVDDYLRLIRDLKKYLNLPLEEVEIKNKRSAPVGRLGDVEIKFMHHASFGLAKQDWSRRISRVNYDNIFLEMTVEGGVESVIREFSKNQERKKVVFSSYPYEIENNVYLRDWDSEIIRTKYSYNYNQALLDISKNRYASSFPIDILKMLLGEKDYIKKI